LRRVFGEASRGGERGTGGWLTAGGDALEKQFERGNGNGGLNGAGPATADPAPGAAETFLLGNAEGQHKPLREATDEELSNCEQQFRQELLGATQIISQVTQRSDAVKQLIAVILFERERRAKTILLPR
jgi:hypothetical protein